VAANIRLGLKRLTVAGAYHDLNLVTSVKGFVVQVLGFENIYKLCPHTYPIFAGKIWSLPKLKAPNTLAYFKITV
jgi:hypothetical protein